MSLNLFLYKENELVLSIVNQEYTIDNQEFIFSYKDDNYRLNITSENFIFIKENADQKFSINYQEKTYTYFLKEYNREFSIACSYQKYLYNKDVVEFEYLIESDEKLNKIIIKLESSD